jgi:anti-sigma factor RsiW
MGSPEDEDRPYAWLDEWLCEYVDGTMDPSLRATFEEYVEANPDLKAHIERLRETRDLLRDCDRLERASERAQRRVCNKVACDMLRRRPSVSDTVQQFPGATVGLTASMAAALLVGFVAGALLFGTTGTSSTPSTTAVSSTPPAQTAPTVDYTAPRMTLPGRPAQSVNALPASQAMSSPDAPATLPTSGSALMQPVFHGQQTPR